MVQRYVLEAAFGEKGRAYDRWRHFNQSDFWRGAGGNTSMKEGREVKIIRNGGYRARRMQHRRGGVVTMTPDLLEMLEQTTIALRG